MMNISVGDGKLTIDVYELLEMLSDEEQLELADTLSIMDHVIEYVAQQILTGWTEMGSHGAKGCDEGEPRTALEKAIHAVALGAGDVAAKRVEDLSAAMVRQHAYHEQIYEWAWGMWHMMNEASGNGSTCPRPPHAPNPYDATPDAFIVIRNDGREEKGEDDA